MNGRHILNMEDVMVEQARTINSLFDLIWDYQKEIRILKRKIKRLEKGGTNVHR
jgi:hypothetical protein